MDRHQLLEQLTESLKRIAGKDLGEAEKKKMDQAVAEFVRDEVGRCRSEEIMDRFITSRGALDLFMTYLQDRICRVSSACCCDASAGDAAACPVEVS